MTRNEKIKKLSNAIKEWRGKRDFKAGKWIVPPNPARKVHVMNWLVMLGLNVEKELETIAAFKKIEEFEEWVRRI